jgi:FkbM family methyltransferase
LRGRHLYMPLSHRLPLYMATNSYYDELPIRLSTFMRTKYGYLSFIDVGANIGDTICACIGSEDDKFLAIEPNTHFARYLRKNCDNIQNCKLLEVYCSSSDGKSQFRIDEKNGTATITEHVGGTIIAKKTIDTIINENHKYRGFNLLKIDTDGNDFQVILGARKWISRNLPAVLFECGIFGNNRYIEDFVETMAFLSQAGYSKAIIYDNFGYIFDLLSLNRIYDFKYSLIYQLISKFYYFDILVMRNEDIEAFVASEIDYFISTMPNKSLQQTAKAAAYLAPP